MKGMGRGPLYCCCCPWWCLPTCQPHCLTLSPCPLRRQANEAFKAQSVRMSCGALESSSAEVKAFEAADAGRAEAERVEFTFDGELLDRQEQTAAGGGGSAQVEQACPPLLFCAPQSFIVEATRRKVVPIGRACCAAGYEPTLPPTTSSAAPSTLASFLWPSAPEGAATPLVEAAVALPHPRAEVVAAAWSAPTTTTTVRWQRGGCRQRRHHQQGRAATAAEVPCSE